jgi:hypothetical protein
MKSVKSVFAVVALTAGMVGMGPLVVSQAQAGAACSGDDHSSPHFHWTGGHKRVYERPIWGGSWHQESWEANGSPYAVLQCPGTTS